MPDHRRALVIDGGKSKTAVAILDAAGGVLATATGPGLAIISEPIGPAALAISLEETLRLVDTTGTFHTAVFGLNGVHAPSPDTDEAAAVLAGLVRVERLVVTSDGVLSYVGALGSRAGVVVTVGTGTVILAVGDDGHAHRVDGNGPLLGDRGSGYAVGIAGLRAGMRVLEGLEGSMMLADEVRGRFGSADEAVHSVHASSTATRLIAAFSRNVADAANRGDAVARAIWRDAAVDLAEGTAAAAAAAGLSQQPYPVAWSGGLFEAGDLLQAPFVEALARVVPDARPHAAAGGALDGGAVLAAAADPMMRGVSSWYAARTHGGQLTAMS